MAQQVNSCDIVMAGGGTLGSVTPLLAIWAVVKKRQKKTRAVWIGTTNGPEKSLVAEFELPYFAIASARQRRYLSLKNLLAPFLFFLALGQSLVLLKKLKPKVVLSAGGYVAVPIVWLAHWLKIKVVLLQPDLVIGRANKMCAWAADAIAVAFDDTAREWASRYPAVSGLPVRAGIIERSKIASDSMRLAKLKNTLGLDAKLPVVLCVGGGTGALALNKLFLGNICEVLKYAQVVHLTGVGKKAILPADMSSELVARYRQFDYLGSELLDYMTIADLVVTRAGAAALAEFAALGKACIVVPLPDSPQEKNASYFADREACEYFKQSDLTPEELSAVVVSLLRDKALAKSLGQKIKTMMPSDAAERLANIIMPWL